MKRRKSNITNLPTSGLLVRLEQYQKELFDLQKKQMESNKFMPVLCERIVRIEDTIYFTKQVIVDRYLHDDSVSLNQIALLFLNSNGIKADVYQEIFVRRIIENYGWVEQSILEKVIVRLSIENLIKISCCQQEMPIKDVMKNHVVDEFQTEELSDAIDNLELEDIWSVHQDEDKNILYELVKISIDERLYHIPEEVEEELLEKIKTDEEEGMENGKYKRKRKIK